MASKVYFTDLRTKPGVSLLTKLTRLLDKAGLNNLPINEKFTAVKIHFGEPGNLAYIRPNYTNCIVDYLVKMGAKPFLTDSCTLYSGRRANGIDHAISASENGYNLLQVHAAPVIIADGLKGNDYIEMPVEGGEVCKTAKIGSAIAQADAIISVTHFKGHEMSGFGGVLKNIGMGAASVAGKLMLHSDSQPVIDIENCRGCQQCVKHCNHGAVTLNAERKAVIDYTKCVGCGQCVAMCAFRAARAVQNTSAANLNKKIAEYTKAVVDGKPSFHISLIMNVSPECDCWGSNDAAIVPDLGIAASADPVALDQACADLVIKAPALNNSMLEDCCHSAETHHHHHCSTTDKFTLLHPDTDWQSGLAHGEKIGLGIRDYELIRV
ncbi:MAG: DUF362 domain-containing protein [Bacteroidales bacterium]|nr:DUF362 domain-containing protein [Bacteroidales bacterium]